jgi:hypothetical protein
MKTTIEHQAALARIEEMRRYADETRRHRRRSGDSARGPGHERSWQRSHACCGFEPTVPVAHPRRRPDS